MTSLGDVQHVCIVDNQNAGQYVSMIDSFKPKDAQKCFICVTKFEAAVDLPANYDYPTHNIILTFNGVQNAYLNSDQNVIVRSQVVDTFMTSYIKPTELTVNGVPNTEYAIYNVVNPVDKWFQISINDLNNFKIRMSTVSSINLLPALIYSNVSDNIFQFFLHLKIRFE